MPIAKLFVEGRLDSEVLNPILKGEPVLQQGGSKYALKPRTRNERKDNGVFAAYLRDRDFDFDPPEDIARPTVDSECGWRWCRHEIENYLLEPRIVSEATAWPLSDVEDAIRQAARSIRGYEAARWTVGIVRRALPPNYDLKTRPDHLGDIDLPLALDTATVTAWASSTIEQHRERITEAAHPDVVRAALDGFIHQFNDAFIDDLRNILLWFSGKDILAGMAESLTTRGVVNAGLFRALLRDWIIGNPTRAVELLPEWNGLIEVLRT